MELYQPSSRSPEPPLTPQLMLEFGQWLQSWADFAQQQASTWLAAADDGPPPHWQNLVMDEAPPAHWLALLQENGMEWDGGSGAAAGQTEKAAWLLDGGPINGRFPHLWLPLFHEGVGFFFQQFGFPLDTSDTAPPAPAIPFTQPQTAVAQPQTAVAQPQPDTAPVPLPAQTFTSPNPLPMIDPNDPPAGSSVPPVLPTGWLSRAEEAQPPATSASPQPSRETGVIQRQTAVSLPIAPQPPSRNAATEMPPAMAALPSIPHAHPVTTVAPVPSDADNEPAGAMPPASFALAARPHNSHLAPPQTAVLLPIAPPPTATPAVLAAQPPAQPHQPAPPHKLVERQAEPPFSAARGVEKTAVLPRKETTATGVPPQTAVSLPITPPSALPVMPTGQPFSPHHEPMPLGQTSVERMAVSQPRSEKAAPIALAGQVQPPAAPTTPSTPSASWPISAGQTPLLVSTPILASALPHTPPTPQPVVPQRPPAPMRVEQVVEMGEKRPFSPPDPTPDHAQATNQVANFAPPPLPPVTPTQPPKPFTWPTLPQPNSPTNLGQSQRHNAGRRQRLNREQRGR